MKNKQNSIFPSKHYFDKAQLECISCRMFMRYNRFVFCTDVYLYVIVHVSVKCHLAKDFTFIIDVHWSGIFERVYILEVYK